MHCLSMRINIVGSYRYATNVVVKMENVNLMYVCLVIQHVEVYYVVCYHVYTVLLSQGSRSITRLGYASGGWIIQLSNVE